MVGDGGDFGLNLRGLLPGPTAATCTDQARTGTLTSKQISSGHTAEHEGTPKKEKKKGLLLSLLSKTHGPWESHGSPVVKTPCFHCRGCEFNPWLGNRDPTCHVAQPKKTINRNSRSKDIAKTKACSMGFCTFYIYHLIHFS